MASRYPSEGFARVAPARNPPKHRNPRMGQDGVRPNQGSAAMSASRMAAVLVIGDRDGVGRGEVGARPRRGGRGRRGHGRGPRGRRPGRSRRARPRSASSRQRSAWCRAALALAEHGMGVRHEPRRRGPRWRPRRRSPGASGTPTRTPARAGRRPRPGSASTTARGAPTSSCWRRSPAGGGAHPRWRRRRPPRPTGAGCAPASGAPVSSSDFIESRIHGHPSPTLGRRPRAEAEVAVDRRDPGDAVVARREDPLDAARRFLGRGRVVQHAPRHDESVRRVDLLDHADDGVARRRAARSARRRRARTCSRPPCGGSSAG